jgi:DNA modification methylase
MDKTAGAFCACGAWYGSLGLEPTPAMYVEHLVEVFREVWRVLRRDGTLWLNLGDSYAQYTENGRHDANVGTDLVDSPKWVGSLDRSWRRLPQGTKRKDLLLMPARVALALQAEGWWVRSDIAWLKRSFLPDPAPDRPSSAWEHVFLLTRSARYYYDREAVREKGSPEQDAHNQRYAKDDYDVQLSKPGNGQPGNVNHRGIHARPGPGGHNMRNYWLLSAEPVPDAHFAVMPTEVARRCIAAGSKPGDTVLDPFVGSGTVVLVADRHGRNGIGFELNAEYAEMARRRVLGEAPLFTEGA